MTSHSASYLRIADVATQLVAEGKWPTVLEVRTRLGSGSNTTINEALKVWRQTFLSRLSTTGRRPDWPVALQEAMESIWQQACQQADSALDSVRAEALADADAARQRASQAEQRQAELEQQLHQLQLNHDATLQRERGLEQTLASAQAQAEALGQQCQALQAQQEDSQRRQAEWLQRHREALAEQETQAQQRLDAALASAKQDAEQREALAYERLDGLRVHLYGQIEAERAGLREARQQWEISQNQLREDMEKRELRLSAQLTALHGEREQLLAQLADSEQQHQRWQQQCQQLNQQQHALQQQLGEAQQALAESRGRQALLQEWLSQFTGPPRSLMTSAQATDAGQG